MNDMAIIRKYYIYLTSNSFMGFILTAFKNLYLKQLVKQKKDKPTSVTLHSLQAL